jgi:putative SOS response-associated peptidase YedK
MCYNVKQTSSLKDLLKRFKAKKGIQNTLVFMENEETSGFIPKGSTEGHKVRVITHDCPEDIQVFRWGLIPENAKDMNIGGGNLNARIETLEDKKSFAGSLNNRCLILIDGFYEHKHLAKKETLKHLIHTIDNKPFAFAGIWREAIAPNGETVQSCAIITTKAQGIMVDIHNNPGLDEPRMPVLLKSGKEREWLEMGLTEFRDQLDSKVNLDLVAIPMRDYQSSLF